MTNKEMYTMIKNNDECQEFTFTKQLKATYFVDSDGKQISFGYDNYSGRVNDHRAIFGLIDNIDRNDWRKLFELTGLLMVIPECMEAYIVKGIELTAKQLNFIKRNKLELTIE